MDQRCSTCATGNEADLEDRGNRKDPRAARSRVGRRSCVLSSGRQTTKPVDARASRDRAGARVQRRRRRRTVCQDYATRFPNQTDRLPIDLHAIAFSPIVLDYPIRICKIVERWRRRNRAKGDNVASEFGFSDRPEISHRPTRRSSKSKRRGPSYPKLFPPRYDSQDKKLQDRGTSTRFLRYR